MTNPKQLTLLNEKKKSYPNGELLLGGQSHYRKHGLLAKTGNLEEDQKRIKEYRKLYRKIHYDRLSDNDKKYRSNHKEKHPDYRKKEYEKNKIRHLKTSKIYREKNREKVRQINKIWREKNKDRLRKVGKKWREDNPEIFRISNLNRSIRVRKEILAVLGNKCCQCGFSDWRALQIDHVNGDGNKDKTRFSRAEYYKKVKQSFIEKENMYQLLCANCNWIKRYEKNENSNLRKKS